MQLAEGCSGALRRIRSEKRSFFFLNIYIDINLLNRFKSDRAG